MNMKASTKGLDKLHSCSMVGTRPISHAKMRNFFVALNGHVIKKWMQDERKNPSDLLESVKVT